MRAWSGIVLVVLLLGGCSASPDGDGGDAAAVARDTLTRRQKDSVTATLPIPQARAVGKALGAAEQAGARATAIDAEQGR